VGFVIAGSIALPARALADVGVQITAPPADASLRGTVALAATAPDGTTSVEFARSSDGGATWHVIATDSDPAGGWTSAWDTTTAPDGSTTLQATAAPGGEIGAEDVIVDNTPPSTEVHAVPALFSPNGDGRRDRTTIRVHLDEPASLAVLVENHRGAVVHTLAAHHAAAAGTTTFVWRGFGSTRRVPDGTYRVVAKAIDGAGNRARGRTPVRVDTTRPRVVIRSVAPTFTATGPLHVRIALRDANGPLRLVARLLHDARIVRTFREGLHPVGRTEISVPVRKKGGAPFPPGLYRVQMTATDAAANRGRSHKVRFVVQHPVHTTVWRRVDGAGRHVALTFDDCNDGAAWNRIVSILHANHVHGTFFCVGDNVVRYPDVARRTVALGNAVGDHTWDHASLPGKTKAVVQADIEKAALSWWTVARVTPLPYFRPPYGAYDSTTLTAAGSLGFSRTMLWDVDPQDWRRPGASAIASRVLEAIRPGSIVIMHTLPQTARALPGILWGLRPRGLIQSSLPELFAAAGRR
jgi:peptidoglycan/xylan/chitin deacetylase (PgdA/CDA1 family)